MYETISYWSGMDEVVSNSVTAAGEKFMCRNCFRKFENVNKVFQELQEGMQRYITSQSQSVTSSHISTSPFKRSHQSCNSQQSQPCKKLCFSNDAGSSSNSPPVGVSGGGIIMLFK
jgi:hypothetical protein